MTIDKEAQSKVVAAINELLKVLPAAQELEPGTRFYTSSEVYGKSRYHMIDKKGDGLQIEQTNIDEQWSKRVNFTSDEISRLLAVVAFLHVKELEKTLNQDDSLGSLDDNPF